jgi:hypothetical protein
MKIFPLLFFLLVLSNLTTAQSNETIEYRKNGSILSASGIDKNGKHYTKIFDDQGEVIAIFKSGDKKYRNGTVTFYGENEEEMQYPYNGYESVIGDTMYYKALGYTSRINFNFTYDSSHYFIRLKLYANGKIARKSYKRTGDKEWTNYYFDNTGKALGYGFSDEQNQPLNKLHIQYYGLMAYGPQPAVPFAKYNCLNGKIQKGEFFNTKGIKVGECTYRNGFPYTGKVLEPDFIWSYFSLQEFKEGLEVGDVIEYDYYFNILNTYSKDGTVQQNRITSKSKKANEYKNGTPYSGVFTIDYSLVEMQDGKRHGVTKIFDFLTRDTIKIINYKTGWKHGYCAFTPINNVVFAEGYFVDDKPFQGDFALNLKSDFQTIESYEEGRIVKKTIYIPKYQGNKYLSLTKYAECTFKDGRPFQGLILNETNYLFNSYVNGVLHGPTFYSRNGQDTSKMFTYFEGRLEGRSFVKDQWTKYIEEGYYKDGKMYNGIFPNEKNFKERFEYKDGTLYKLHVSESNFKYSFEISEGKKEGNCDITYQHNKNNNWNVTFKNNVPFDGEYVLEHKIIPYKNGKVTGIYKEYEDSGNTRLNAKYTLRDSVKHGTAVIYNIYYTGDSLKCDYTYGNILNGPLIKTDLVTRTKTIYQMKNGLPGTDSIYTYRSYDDKPWETLKFKNGKVFEGVKYDYECFGKREVFKDYLLVESMPFLSEYKFSTKCQGLECRFVDMDNNISNIILYDTLNNSLQLTTTEKGIETAKATFKNQLLTNGSYVFYNYKSNKRNDHFIWDKARISIDKNGTSIELKNKNLDFYPVYTCSKKMNIPYPCYDANPLISKLRNDEDSLFEIEFRDVNTKELLCKSKCNGWTVLEGCNMEQSGNQVKIEIYKNGIQLKEQQISADKIKAWLASNK